MQEKLSNLEVVKEGELTKYTKSGLRHQRVVKLYNNYIAWFKKKSSEPTKVLSLESFNVRPKLAANGTASRTHFLLVLKDNTEQFLFESESERSAILWREKIGELQSQLNGPQRAAPTRRKAKEVVIEKEEHDSPTPVSLDSLPNDLVSAASAAALLLSSFPDVPSSDADPLLEFPEVPEDCFAGYSAPPTIDVDEDHVAAALPSVPKFSEALDEKPADQRTQAILSPRRTTLTTPSAESASRRKCHICRHSFHSFAELQLHARDVHDSPATLPCPFPGCTRSYTTEENLNLHVTKYHGGDEIAPSDSVRKGGEVSDEEPETKQKNAKEKEEAKLPDVAPGAAVSDRKVSLYSAFLNGGE